MLAKVTLFAQYGFLGKYTWRKTKQNKNQSNKQTK